MSWLSELLQGVPLNAVLRERVALAEQKFKEIEQDKKKLEEKVSALEAENADLKQKIAAAADQASREKPKFKWGCYVFEGEPDRLYCPACFDTKGKKHLTTRINSNRRMCSVCQAALGS
jgi:predicted nuclease with TOPRIM domain